MAELINLGRARKAKARAERDAQAATNRTTHGLTKAEKQRIKAEAERARRRLDGHEREEP